jgi:hypothetical protein
VLPADHRIEPVVVVVLDDFAADAASRAAPNALHCLPFSIATISTFVQPHSDVHFRALRSSSSES